MMMFSKHKSGQVLLIDRPGLFLDSYNKLFPVHGLSGLSMGMSSDFETAAALGATQVRPDASQQNPEPEGLGDIIIGP